MKKLIVLFLTIFVLALPMSAVIITREDRAVEFEMVGEPMLIVHIEPAESLPTQTVPVLVDEIEQTPTADAPPVTRYELTDEERNAIERMVASEGGYCPYEFQALVATCILNGCEAEDMRPTDLFERGDFWITHNVEPTETTKQAVSDVFDRGILPTEEKVRYYYNPNYCESALHEQMCYVLTNCGCRFFKDWD